MLTIKEKFALQSVRNKIIIAFLFGCLVVFFSWAIARVVFKETFLTINKISEPNPKLRIVNTLFQKVNQLEQSQKLQILKNPGKAPESFIKESKQITYYLDTLQALYAGDTAQAKRLELIKTVLLQRDKLLFNYLKFHGDLMHNTSLSNNMRELSDYISDNMKQTDSSVVTTKKKTTTTTTSDAAKEEVVQEKQESFFKRLFSRKKPVTKPTQALKKSVTEDVITTVDTLAIAQRDSFMKDMESVIDNIEKDQYNRGSKLINHELKLANANNAFINELQQLLQQIQDEEITELQNNTQLLSDVFNTAFTRIGIVLLVFLLLAIVLIFLMFSDISQSNKTQLELIEAKEKAEYMEKVKERFLANMSHEIRTPLQSIIGYAEQIKEQPDPKKEAIDAIYRSSEHLLQIVNEVLDYSRITSGKFSFEHADFNMEEVLAEVSDNIEGQAELKHIHFKFKSDIPQVLHKGDSFRLKQILYNLLSNAIKFTDHGEVSFLVSSKNTDKVTEFIFEVKDTGIGMTADEIKKIFNVFEQATESTQRHFGGTGLGLSIAKTLVEMQAGKITVNSEKGKGTVFTVTLGYLKSTSREHAKELSPDAPTVSYHGKVLLVDDDELILNLCSSILKKHAIDHVCYQLPEKVLQDPWDKSITLALMDIRMPKLSGIELCQKLRQQTGNTVKFVALTAQVLPEEREALLKQGFDTVLLKPFREKDLLQLFGDFTTSDDHKTTITMDGLDLSSIYTMCGNDSLLIKQTLELFIAETTKDIVDLKLAIDSKNEQLLSEVCHKLAGKTGQIGAQQLLNNLRYYENSTDLKQLFTVNGADKLYGELNELIIKIRSCIIAMNN